MISVAESRRSMAKIAAKSNMLWRSVNNTILNVLNRHRSREQMAEILDEMAGPEKKGEPMSIGNYRTAARQLREGKLVYVL